MTAYKLILVFTVLLAGIVGTLWALGVFPEEQATEIGTRGVVVILIMGFSAAVITSLVTKKRPTESTSTKDHAGPKF
ncbi:MAG: hypothetical protein V4736_13820 [Bdellovibrionota bacterium]